MKYLKNILAVLALAIIVFTVFGVSFIMGDKIFYFYTAKVKESLPGNVANIRKEMPDVAAIVPKADEIVVEEIKSGVKDSVPEKMVLSASDIVSKVINPVMGKNMVQLSTEKIVAPVSPVEKQVAAAKPELTMLSVKPRAIAFPSTVKPAVKLTTSEPKQKTAVKAKKKHKEYKVVAASFSIEVNANNLNNQLKAENYDPIIVQANISTGKFYRVIVGSYGSLSEAHGKIKELKKYDLQPFCILEYGLP